MSAGGKFKPRACLRARLSNAHFASRNCAKIRLNKISTGIRVQGIVGSDTDVLGRLCRVVKASEVYKDALTSDY